MKKFLLGLVLALASIIPAFGKVTSYVARQGEDFVVVHTDIPCRNEAILALIPDELKPHFGAAMATIGGKNFNACFIPHNGAVFLIYEDGDKGVIPMDQFKPLTEA